MKVAFLTHIFSFGGATVSLYLLNKQLSQQDGIERKVYVVDIIDESFVKKFEETGASTEQVHIKPIYNFQYGHVPFINFLYYRTINYKNFIRKLEEDGIDILHFNSTVFSHLAHQVRKYSKIKVVTHIRELLPYYRPGIIQHFVTGNINRYSDAIIAISNQEAIHFTNHPNLHIIPNPVENIAAEGFQPNGTMKIGMVANMSEGKGQLLFIRAAALLKDRLAGQLDFSFYIVGARQEFVDALKSNDSSPLNDFEKRCMEELIRKDLLSHVNVIAYTHNVADIISNWTVYVRPSLSADPWGRDIIEAMALGLPVIATGSSEFYVKSGENGILVPEIAEAPLADAIYNILSNRDLQTKFRSNNIRKIKEMCSMELHAAKITNIYKQLMK